MRNRTWVDIMPQVGFETIAVSASATRAGFDLYTFDFCALCFDTQLGGDIPIDLFSNTFAVDTPGFMLDPIVFYVDLGNVPRISGASRPGLSAIIYDQIDADPFELAAFVNQNPKKMLVYGDVLNLAELTNFVLCVNGRIVDLPTTILNSRTALVEIPNDIRLVPGVGRIWAVDSSDIPVTVSIDFPITLPRPNLATVGPNLWAADPRLTNVPIDTIDGLTPGGEPSFVARRDYWFVLRDMWDEAFGGSRGDLFSLYPDFDFDADPPIPAVLVECQELPIVEGATHRFSIEGEFSDSAGMALLTPQGPTPDIVSDGVPAFTGQAVEMDGDGLDIDPATLTPLGTSDYWLAMWFKRNDRSNTHMVLDADEGSSGYAFYLDSDGQLRHNMNSSVAGAEPFSRTRRTRSSISSGTTTPSPWIATSPTASA